MTTGAQPMSADERVKILRDAAPNTWVAFSSDESCLVSCGATYSEAVELAEKSGESDPVLIKIPDNWNARTFALCE
jgi:hypothetical protein